MNLLGDGASKVLEALLDVRGVVVSFVLVLRAVRGIVVSARFTGAKLLGKTHVTVSIFW